VTQPLVRLTTGEHLEGDLVALGCFKNAEPDAGRLARRLAAALRRACDQPNWKALEKQTTRATTGGSKPIVVEVHGLGAAASFGRRQLARWVRRVVSRASEEGRREITLVLPDHSVAQERSALQILLQLLMSGYRYDRFKRRDRRPTLRVIHLLPPDGQDPHYQEALRLARPVARGIGLARDLGNTPPNEATPEWMSEQAQAVATKQGMDIQVLGPKELEKRGMGGILAVGAGSSIPPRLVRLEWGEGDEVVSLVGKGVTFDTGGISLKPSADMEEMKYDKCGACTVLGIAQAAAEIDLPRRFRVYLPLVENMPDGGSYRPGDIVRCYNGKTVEILDTDAEGRMILADALAWAAEEKPGTLLEYSTLTGASVVALGHHGAALYSPDDELAADLIDASARTGERLWQMPLWPEFDEDMKGTHADLRNLGSRWGGANSAAAFLGNFVGRTRRWAHLDIAATAYKASREGRISGATGFGVSLTLDWLLATTGRF